VKEDKRKAGVEVVSELRVRDGSRTKEGRKWRKENCERIDDDIEYM
jgi:hypothetical protein